MEAVNLRQSKGQRKWNFHKSYSDSSMVMRNILSFEDNICLKQRFSISHFRDRARKLEKSDASKMQPVPEVMNYESIYNSNIHSQ